MQKACVLCLPNERVWGGGNGCDCAGIHFWVSWEFAVTLRTHHCSFQSAQLCVGVLETQVEHHVGEKLYGFSRSLQRLQHESCCSYAQQMREIFRMKNRKIPCESVWEWGNAEINSWTRQPLRGFAASYLSFFTNDEWMFVGLMYMSRFYRPLPQKVGC